MAHFGSKEVDVICSWSLVVSTRLVRARRFGNAAVAQCLVSATVVEGCNKKAQMWCNKNKRNHCPFDEKISNRRKSSYASFSLH